MWESGAIAKSNLCSVSAIINCQVENLPRVNDLDSVGSNFQHHGFYSASTIFSHSSLLFSTSTAGLIFDSDFECLNQQFTC